MFSMKKWISFTQIAACVAVASVLGGCALAELKTEAGHGQPPKGDQADMVALGKQWASPLPAPAGMEYVLFPASSVGPDIKGSVLVYKPDGYDSSVQRYPVLYFLHGGTGDQQHVDQLLPAYIAAMKNGAMPKVLIVSVQGLPIGWYVNATTGVAGVTSGPVEDVIIKDMLPYIDSHYRTIADRNARGLEGWSMGGFGAMRLAFKYNDLFANASSLSGAVIDFEDEPMKIFLENTFGPATDSASLARFDAVKPLTEAMRNRDKIIGRTHLRLCVGDQDWLYDKQSKKITQRFSQALNALGIANEYVVIKGIGHDLPQAIAQGQTPYPAAFWNQAFSAYR